MDKIISIEQFKGLLKDGMSIMVGGFMACGTAEPLMDAIVDSRVKDLTIICNDAGLSDMGVGKLINFLQVKKLIASHIGLNPTAQPLQFEPCVRRHVESLAHHGVGGADQTFRLRQAGHQVDGLNSLCRRSFAQVINGA